MEWREALGEARAAKDAEGLDELDAQLKGERTSRLAKIARELDAGNYEQAAQDVRALMFLDKFGDEVHYAFEALEI
jgi:molecular chaperone HscB